MLKGVAKINLVILNIIPELNPLTRWLCEEEGVAGKRRRDNV